MPAFGFFVCLQRALAPLLLSAGLVSQRHLARTLPAALSVLAAADLPSVRAALELLSVQIRVAWPRVAAHAPVIWTQVLAAAEGLFAMYGPPPEGMAGREGAHPTRAAVWDAPAEARQGVWDGMVAVVALAAIAEKAGRGTGGAEEMVLAGRLRAAGLGDGIGGALARAAARVAEELEHMGRGSGVG